MSLLTDLHFRKAERGYDVLEVLSGSETASALKIGELLQSGVFDRWQFHPNGRSELDETDLAAILDKIKLLNGDNGRPAGA
jgi:hypothetical protein